MSLIIKIKQATFFFRYIPGLIFSMCEKKCNNICKVQNMQILFSNKFVNNYFQIENKSKKRGQKSLIPRYEDNKRKYTHFYETIAALMTFELQSMCIESLREYTDFILDLQVSTWKLKRNELTTPNFNFFLGYFYRYFITKVKKKCNVKWNFYVLPWH